MSPKRAAATRAILDAGDVQPGVRVPFIVSDRDDDAGSWTPSSFIEEGGNIQEVKEAARHKSIQTTARYIKTHDERVKALLERRAQRIDRA